MKNISLVALLLSATIVTKAQGQLKLPSLSPLAKITQEFSTSEIEINYSRPSMRGRKIFGDVRPYNVVWRTGANSPTKIKLGEDLEIAGHKVTAGEYVLYTIPGPEMWEVIINTGEGTIGQQGYNRQNDIARFMVKPAIMENECQTFTIEISDITFSTCKIELMWERTKIVLPVVARNEERIELSINEAMSRSPKPYFQVANYYFEKNKRLDVAEAYVDSAAEANPKAFYVWYLKARIEKKLGHNAEAIAAAKKSMETVKGSDNELEYMHNNQKLIDEIEKSRRHRQEDQ